MIRYLLTVVALLLTTQIEARDPNALDTTILLKNAVAGMNGADTSDEASRKNLQCALATLEELQNRFPTFQPDVVKARLADCRRRLKSSTTANSGTPAAVVTPTKSTILLNYERALVENRQLRSLLAAAKADGKQPIVDLSPELVNALKTVGEQAKMIRTMREKSDDAFTQHAKLSAIQKRELNKLSQINIDILAGNKGLKEQLKKTRDGYATLEKKKFAKLTELKTVKKDNATLKNELDVSTAKNTELQTILTQLEDGDSEALRHALTKSKVAERERTKQFSAECLKNGKLKLEKTEQRQQMDILQLCNGTLRNEIRQLTMGAETLIINDLETLVGTLKKELKSANATNQRLKLICAAKDEMMRSDALQTSPVPPSNSNQELLNVRKLLIGELTAQIERLKEESTLLKATLSERTIQTHVKTGADPRLAAGSALTDAQRQELQILKQQAEAALRLNDFDAAKSLCGRALKQFPSDADVNLLMAKAYLGLKRYLMAARYATAANDAGMNLAQSIAIFETTCRTRPKSVEWLSIACKLANDYPANATLSRLLGRTLRENGAINLAEVQLCHAWSLKKEFDTAKEFHQLYRFKGKAYDKQQKLWYGRAIELNPKRIRELIITESKGRIE